MSEGRYPENSIRVKKAVIYSPKQPKVISSVKADFWENHRAFETIVKGEGGRPVVISVSETWSMDKHKLLEIKKERDQRRS
jgi:hypothetical protein